MQALGRGITLDAPLARSHEFGTPVVNARATGAGYQGTPAPNQWFGGSLSPSAGSIALIDAGGVAVVDAIVYGSQQSNSSGNGTIASPELAVLEGDQGKGGCIVIAPAGGRFGGRGGLADASDRSVGRFPDGADADSNCTDFLLQTVTTLQAPSATGTTNIKVAGVADFSAGQTLIIDAGANRETAVIATVGTPGATMVGTATTAGATVIPVAGSMGFSAGQNITIDDGANQEIAVIASVAGGRGGRGGGSTITVGAPLKFTHAERAQVAGSGITLTAALTKAHDAGAQVATSVSTPGASNQYYRKHN